MDPSVSRRMWGTLEPIHAVVYFAPEAPEEYGALGIGDGTDRLAGYFPSRAAPMGAVSTKVVEATFFNFAPRRVAEGMTGVWDRVSPDQFLAARLRIADRVLRKLCPDLVDTAETAEAAAIARAACAGCRPYGRPLFAGYAGLPWPEEPHLALWHAATVLREFRGDGHIAALVTEGYSGLAAAVSHVAQNGRRMQRVLRTSRGYSEREWDEEVARLRDAGDLDGDAEFTAQGAARRRRVEDHTDVLALPAWETIGSEGADRLRALARPLALAIAERGRFPLSRNDI